MLCPGCCDASPGPPSKGSSSPPRPSAAELSEGDIFAKSVSMLPFNRQIVEFGGGGGENLLRGNVKKKYVCVLLQRLCRLTAGYQLRGKRVIVLGRVEVSQEGSIPSPN